jgi:hypothetical protein
MICGKNEIVMSGTMMPRVRVRLVFRLRATWFGW